jgi:hypothetical protein
MTVFHLFTEEHNIRNAVHFIVLRVSASHPRESFVS